MADNIKICAPDDPNRCQGVTAFGQCNKLSIEGRERCPMHDGAKSIKDRKEIQGYQIAKWQVRLDRLAGAESVRSLRTEIGVLKMTLEALLNRCHDEDDLIEKESAFSNLIMKIEKIVVSCSRLERTTGMMLDKTAALQIAANICNIIGEELSDPAQIERITDKIINQVLNVETVNVDA
jgi:hypothetical protein